MALKPIELLPYAKLSTGWSVPDEVMAHLYVKMDKQRLIYRTFGRLLSIGEFADILQKPDNLPVVIAVDGELGGIGWINGVANNYAYCHFCFLKETWGTNTHEMARMLIDYWFSFQDDDGNPMFDVLLGITPANNKPALKFIEEVGFKLSGLIPKVDKVGGYISYIERESDGRQIR